LNKREFNALIGEVTAVLRKFLRPELDVLDRLSAAKKKAQDDCPHLQGCSGPLNLAGSVLGGLKTSIIWHTFEDDEKGKPKGVCTNCQRVFLPTDKDYEYWRGQPSGNLPSSGGIREKLPDPLFPIDELYEDGDKVSLKQFIREKRIL
jgi:hypothetical protein